MWEVHQSISFIRRLTPSIFKNARSSKSCIIHTARYVVFLDTSNNANRVLRQSKKFNTTDPAEALDADVEGVRSARRAVDDAVLQLVVGRGAGHPAEEFTAVLHQNCGWRDKTGGG